MINLSNLFDTARNIYTALSYNDRYGRAPIPLRYFFELTYRCNLNCPYCYIGSERKKDELSKEEWFKVIDQIPFYSIVTLVGGEPLIRKDFPEILNYLSKKIFNKTHVVSNGILITPEIIKEFERSKLMLLSVSLDGYGEVHDKNRGQNGIFDKIISNLDNVQKLKKPPMIDIKTIVLPDNLDSLPKLYKLCNDMDFDFFSISFLRNNNLKQNAVLADAFIPEFTQNYPIEPYFDMEHFKEVYKELEDISKKSKVKIRFAPKFEYTKSPLDKIEAFFKLPADMPVTDIYKPCKYPYTNMMINPEGDVYPCLSMKIGNVKENSIRELFNKPHYCCFRKNLKASGGVFGACQMCCELEPKERFSK